MGEEAPPVIVHQGFSERFAWALVVAVVVLFLALASAVIWLAESNATLNGEIKAEQQAAQLKAYRQCLQGNITRHNTGGILTAIIDLTPTSFKSVRDPLLVRQRDQELVAISARIQANYARSDNCGSAPP